MSFFTLYNRKIIIKFNMKKRKKITNINEKVIKRFMHRAATNFTAQASLKKLTFNRKYASHHCNILIPLQTTHEHANKTL